MDQIATAAFVFLIGITLCGVFGSLLELTVGARLSFAAPFFDRSSRLGFVVAVVVAGPLMLSNDAIEARKAGRLDILSFATCALTALVWTMAIGVCLAALARGL